MPENQSSVQVHDASRFYRHCLNPIVRQKGKIFFLSGHTLYIYGNDPFVCEHHSVADTAESLLDLLVIQKDRLDSFFKIGIRHQTQILPQSEDVIRNTQSSFGKNTTFGRIRWSTCVTAYISKCRRPNKFDKNTSKGKMANKRKYASAAALFPTLCSK